METNSSQSRDLVQGVLERLPALGLSTGTISQYERAYGRIKHFFGTENLSSYSETMHDQFMKHVEECYRVGRYGRSRRNHLRRTAFILWGYAASGTVTWLTSVSLPVLRGPEAEGLALLYSGFLGDLRQRSKSANTIQSSKNIIRQFLMFLEHSGYRELSTVPPAAIPLFFRHLLTTYRSTSIRTVASHVRSFLSYAENEPRLVRAVPLRCVRKNPIIPILSEEERSGLRRLLQTDMVSLRDNAIITLALRTGLRAIDIVNMQLSDIDWIHECIVIPQVKTRRVFRIPLTVDVGNALSRYILEERPQASSRYIFLRVHAPFRPLTDHSSCYTIVRKAFHQAGIRLGSERKGIHLIRHSVASRLLAKGVAVTTIASMLGHSNKTSTEVYLSTDQNRLRECALDLSEIPLSRGDLK